MAITKSQKLALVRKITSLLVAVVSDRYQDAENLANEADVMITDALFDSDQNGASDEQSPGFHYGGGGCTRGILKPQTEMHNG